jgi:DNA-binding transcriptional LysR family regulator
MPKMDQLHDALSDMALFVEVARTRSFRAAAARLTLPPSTLSRRIAAMEARLGVALLLRTTRSVTLTSAGQPYYEACLKVIEAAARAQEALVSGQQRQARMRIAMPVDLGVELLGSAIAAFVDAHHGLQVELDLSSRAVDLLRDPLDLAVRIGKPMDDRVVARKIADVTSGVYAAPSLLKRLAPLTQPEQLERLPCLDLRTAHGSMPWRVGSMRWATAPGPTVLAANSVALLRKFAEEGRGFALLPDHVAAQGVTAGRLTPALRGLITPTWPVYAVTAGRAVPHLVRLLIAHLKRRLAHSELSSPPKPC